MSRINRVALEALWAIVVVVALSGSVRSAETKDGGKGKALVTKPQTKTSAKTTGKAKTKPASVSAKDKGKAAKASKTVKTAKNGKASKVVEEVKPPPPPTRASGKVAVFLFDGDGAAPLQARVVRLLRARGLKVTTTLRPVDSAEQYREMAETLNLAAFVDGEVSEDGDQASVTVLLRSGISGLRVASATLAGARRTLPGDVDKSLWPQLGPPLVKVCVEAAKPRKREHEPLRIEAGTPLDNPPPDAPNAPEAAGAANARRPL